MLLKLGDNISTDDILPGGARVLPLRSNIPALAKFTFEYIDQGFEDRARAAGGGFVVAGDNYGQGSSREHAAATPSFLGVKAVVAKGFARIHLDNLVTFGVVPLVFRDPNAYEGVDQADRLRLVGVRGALQGTAPVLAHVVGREHKFELVVPLTERKREMVLAGGALRWLKMQRRGQVPVPEATY